MRGLLDSIQDALQAWDDILKKAGFTDEDLLKFRSDYPHLFQQSGSNHASHGQSAPPAPPPLPFRLWRGYPCRVVAMALVLVSFIGFQRFRRVSAAQT